MRNTIIELFEDCVHRHGGAAALRHFSHETWETTSWKSWWTEAERIAAALIDAGLQPGDRVAILSDTRLEWLLTDIAVMMAGGVLVPLYPSAGVASTAHIVRDSAPKFAFVENPSQLDKLTRADVGHSDMLGVVLLDQEANFVHGDWDGRARVAMADVDWPESIPLFNFDTFTNEGRRCLADDSMLVASRRAAIVGEDVATIVYTSGTEQLPKGVVLTHGNLRAEADGLRALELLRSSDRQLLFLPLAHIFARALLLTAVGYGIETVVGRGPAHLLEDVVATSPTYFAAVPQIYERLHLSFESEARRHGGWRERVFDVATTGSGFAGGVGQRIAGEWVKRRIETALGQRIRFLVSGGAPLARSTAEFFCGAGIPLFEGYGLTETTAVTCANHPDDFRIGTVGRPLPGAEVAIDEDGEILVRGETVARGYWGREQPLVDSDGWFATGDLGAFDRDGYLSITGRKKEMIVTSGGKNIPPAPIEAAFRSSPLISDAFAHGDQRPYLTVLLVPEVNVVEELAAQEGIELPPRRAWNEDPFVRRLMSGVVDELNAERARFEMVRRFAIAPTEFVEATGERTPTGKLRRDAISKARSELLDSMYER